METASSTQSMSVRRIALGVALGILAAAVVLFVVYRATQPSELECAIQRTDVALGNIEPFEMDSGCR